MTSLQTQPPRYVHVIYSLIQNGYFHAAAFAKAANIRNRRDPGKWYKQLFKTI